MLIQALAAPFGYQWDFLVLNEQLAGIVNTAFMVLAIIGIPVDMTTEGFGDSVRALAYDEPAPSAHIEEVL